MVLTLARSPGHSGVEVNLAPGRTQSEGHATVPNVARELCLTRGAAVESGVAHPLPQPERQSSHLTP